MEKIDVKQMRCCEYVVFPKINTHQEPYIVHWKCPKCGKSMQQKITGSDLVIYEIAQSIDINKAFPNS